MLHNFCDISFDITLNWLGGKVVHNYDIYVCIYIVIGREHWYNVSLRIKAYLFARQNHVKISIYLQLFSYIPYTLVHQVELTKDV